MSRHECRWKPPWRGKRRCGYCNAVEYQVATVDGRKMWRRSMTIQAFGDKWLPAISGTQPEKMLVVDVAFPFEWNCYESWNIVFRARFDFTDVLGRTQRGLGTPVDVMNGWRSEWAEDFCRIDVQACGYYAEKTGREYDIGDNTYREMRAIIQSPISAPKPPSLKIVP